jgi:hypothetical protein
MHWPQAIARNRTALLAVVASIVALVGGREGGPVARGIRNAALALLRPAEAAARRLIIIAARGLVLPPRPAPTFSFPPVRRSGPGGAGSGRRPAFRLVDPRKRFGRRLKPPARPAVVPRIRTFWPVPPRPVAIATPPPAQPVGPRKPVDPQELVDAARLRLRIAALDGALADLPRQARRLARWRAREGGGRRFNPRPAAPPPCRRGAQGLPCPRPSGAQPGHVLTPAVAIVPPIPISTPLRRRRASAQSWPRAPN